MEDASASAAAPPAVGPQEETTSVEARPPASPRAESDYESDGSTGPQTEGSDSEGSVGLERQSGDGQESQPAKRVDDDEDKKNPQYIPKRGTFYEHDDRTAEEEAEENVVENDKDKDPKKKVWQEKREKWSHDRFNDTEQAPKSRAELVAIYGYDIRNEDGPPRARRRRRYGRGPNKYTRNWEDEDAYGKTIPVRPKKPPQRRPGNDSDEYPSLTSSTKTLNERNRDRLREDNYEQHQPEEDSNRSEPPLPPPPQPQQQQQQQKQQHVPSQQQHPQQQFSGENQRNQARVGSGRVIKPKREIKDSDYRGFTAKTRQVRNMKTEQKVLPKRKEEVIQTQNFTNRNNMPDLEKEMGKLNVQEGPRGKQGGQRQGSVPPRLQSESKGSKRYSSIRQRSLPESGTPPFNQPQHSNYYTNEFNQNQVNLHQNAQIHPSTTQVPQIAPPPLPPIPQAPVTAAPILPPPQFAPPFAQAPPFLQPAPAFLPPQQPQIINYVPSPPQFPQGFQGYQQQFNQNQPELFQPQGGITYYSADQQVAQRPAAPPKRPKAAIPIVAPPPLCFKGKMKEDEMAPYEGDVSATSDGQTEDESISQDCGKTWNLVAINSSHFNR